MRVLCSRRTAAVLAIIGIAVAGLRAQSPSPILARDQILITGGTLQVSPAYQAVPRNIAAVVQTTLTSPGPAAETSFQLPADALVLAELRGPAFETAVTLTTRPGAPFKIQPLALSGLYFLDNIRVVSGGKTLLLGNPSTVTLEVIDKVLVSQVSSRPLSADEIKKKGIVVDQTNFQVVNFTAAFGVQGHQIPIDFPMIVPTRAGADLPPAAPAISLPSLQLAATPLPFAQLPQLQEAFQTANVGVSGLLLKIEDEDIEQSFNVPPLPALLVFPGRIAYLNQFFSVLTMVSNVAPGNSTLTVHDVKAEIVLPLGGDGVLSNDDPLRMAKVGSPPVEQPKSQPVLQVGPDGQLGTDDDILTIAPQQSGNAEHLVEGLREGTHTVLVKISAMLDLPIGPVKISGSAVGTIEVRNPTFALTLSHPATVTAGEEYDMLVTVTNTSESPANFLSLSLLPRSISGAKLLSAESVQVDTVAAGDSATVAFHLLSQRTGTVVATSFASEGVPGKFELTHQVGALGIPMSANSLVLSSAANGLPAQWRTVGTGFLGQAFALATSPVTPKGLLPMTQQIVYERATQLSEAGQRLTMGDSLTAVARDLAFDWTGNDFARISERFTDQPSINRTQQDFRAFDELVRQSKRSAEFMQLLAGVLGSELQADGVFAFHEAWADASASRPGHISAVTASGSGAAPVVLNVVDPGGRRLGAIDPNSAVSRQIPFGEFLTLIDTSPAFSQMAMVSVPTAGPYVIEATGTSSGTFDLSLVVPEGTELRRLTYQNVAIQTGGKARVRFTLGAADNTYQLEVDQTGDGSVEQQLVPTANSLVVDAGPQLVSAVQIVTGKPDLSQFGQLVGLLFSEVVSKVSSQTDLEPAQLTHYSVEANQVLGASLQQSGRVVLLSLRDGYGPFFSRNVAVNGIEDRLGHPMLPSTMTLPILADAAHLSEGGSISGQVKRGDGTPVPGARIRFSQKAPVEVSQGALAGLGDLAAEKEVTVTVKDADASGKFAFDYVRSFNIAGAFSRFEAVDLETGEHGTIATQLHHSGEHLDLDIIFIGTGRIAGRVLAADGVTPLPGAVVRVSSLTNFGETFGAVTDASGAYAINGVPVGNVTIDAAHVATNSKTLLASVIPTSGATVVQNLILIPLAEIVTKTGTLKGQVFHSAGMTPAAGVPVFTTLGGVATTDASGGYRIEGLPVGVVTVRAIDQVALEQGSVGTTIVANTEITANIVLLGGTGTIHGVVLDSLGAHVANALVGGGPALVRTNANGEFTLTGMPLGVRTITVLDEVRNLPGSATVNLTTPGETAGVQVILQAKGSIAGRVFEANGTTPVAGLTVFLLGGLNPSTVTDANGAYRFDGVPVGPYTVSAFRPDFSDGNLTQTKLVFQGEVRQANVIFRGKGQVIAKVFAADGVTPLGATVALFPLQVKTGLLRPPENMQCLTDVQVGDMTLDLPRCQTVGVGFTAAPPRIVNNDVSSGTVTFADVFVGAFTVQAANAINPGIMSASGTIEHAGDTVTVNLKLGATSSARGTVYETDGVTRVPREVIVTLNPGDLTAATCGGASPCGEGEQGRYEFPLVIPGQFTATAVDASTGLVGQTQGSVEPGQKADIPIRLLGKGTVTVTVRGSNGPITGAQVTLRGANFPYDVRNGTTAAAGTLTFSGGDSVTEGSFSVTAFDPATGVTGFAGSSMPAAGAHVDVSLLLPDEAGTVRGRFLTPDGGTGVANAQIHLASSRGEAYETTAPDGSFVFEGVPKGALTLEAFHPATARRGRSTGQVSANHDDVTIDILEVPQGSVKGFVRESKRQSAVANALVTLSAGSIFGGQFATTTGADGSYRFPAVSQGPFTVTASDSLTGLSGSAQGTLATEDQEVLTNVLIEVPAIGRVEGVVRNAAGGIALGAQVVMNNGVTTTVNNDGFYFFDAVPKGPVSVLAVAQLGPDAGRAVGEIAFDGDIEHLDVQFIGTGTVSGTVLKDGAPVDFAAVTLTGRNALNRPQSVTTQTDSLGHFQAGAFLLGDVSATATQAITQLAGSAAGTLAVNGAVLDLAIVLEPSGSMSGRIFREDGTTPAAGMALELVNGSRRFGSTAPDGRFTFADLSLGTYHLTVTDPVGSGIAIATAQLTAQGQSVSFGNLILDECPPSVLSIVPANGTSLVPVTQTIVVTFSEPVDPATITNATLIVGGVSGAVPGAWTLNAQHTVATFTPSAPFRDFSPFTIKVTTSVKDRYGKGLTADVVSSFTTADSTPPVTLSLSPANSARDVALDSVLRVGFSESVDPARFVAPAIALSLNGSAVSGRTDFILNNTVAVFTPNAPLLPNQTYQAVIRPAADIFGNFQGAGTTLSFNTLDTLAPAINQLSAASTTVIEGSTVTITANVGGATDVASVEFLVNGQVVSTDRAAPYTLDVPVTSELGASFTVTARATDFSGNVGLDKSLSLTVAPDAPPTVTIQSPADGTTVSAGTRVTVGVHANDDRGVTQISFQASGSVAMASTALTPVSASADATFFFDIPANASPGVITVKASARDTHANTSQTASIALTLSDTVAPSVQIVSPAAGAKVDPGQIVDIVVAANDNGAVQSISLQTSGVTSFSETRSIAPPQKSVQATFQVTIPATATDQQSLSVNVQADDTAGSHSAVVTRQFAVRGPSGSIGGTVFAFGGSAPASGFLVRLTGGVPASVTTGANGGFQFTDVPLGTYALEVLDANGRLRAKAANVVLASNGEAVTRNVTLVGTATVSGVVFNPDGSGAASVPLVLLSANSEIGASFSGTTNGVGQYSFTDVPIGSLTVTATDAPHQLSGTGAGVIVQHGQPITVDVQLLPTVNLPVNRFDANNFTFDIQRSGGVHGTRGLFAGDFGTNQGGLLLQIVAAGTPSAFLEAPTGKLEDGGREVAIQQSTAGLDVTRKVFVPRSGYFARYLEILSNPGTTPVTVDLRVVSHLTTNYGAKQIVQTSSGDAILDVGGGTPDRWLVLDDGNDADPFGTDNMPAAGFAFDGVGAADRAAAASLTGGNPDHLIYEWDNVTIPPGGTVAYLHFAVQQTSRAAAQASVERLAQLPPEALAGLNAAEIGQVRNFSIAADGSSSLAPLPAIDGHVQGHVFAADQTTAVGGATVRFASKSAFFGRAVTVTADGTGAFAIDPALTDDGTSRVVPIGDFTLQATHPTTGAQSPLTNGSFAQGQTTATQNVAFTASGILTGSVTRTGAVVTTGTVRVTGPTLPSPIVVNIGADSRYQFTGLPAGTYELLATVPHPQGTALFGTASDTVTAGTTTDRDIPLQPTGAVAGVVSRANAQPAGAVPVQLVASGFARSTSTDAAGNFSLLDVPTGSFTLTASDAATETAASAVVSVAAGFTTNRNLTLTPTSFTLSVSRTGAGTGTISSTPQGVLCGLDCTERFAAGVTVQITASPSPGSTFAGWDGACSGTTTNTCVVTMDSDRTASARFDPGASVACVLPPSGLVSFWPGDADGTDIAGPNNGVFSGDATTAAGYIRNAFRFAGNGSIVVPDHPSLMPTRQLTIEAWVNPASAGHGRSIVQKRSSVGGYVLETTHAPYGPDNGLQFGIWINTGLKLLQTPPGVLEVGAWHHVAATFDGSVMKIFVEGVERASVAVEGQIDVSREPVVIGRNVVNSSFAWDGLIDEIGLYNRALSSSEINAIFTAGAFGKCKGAIFDATSDFSAVKNPNGLWTYGALAVDGTFARYGTHDLSGSLNRWHAAVGFPDLSQAPNVLRNGTGTVFSDASGSWPIDQLALNPGTTEFSAVRWTAPTAGVYNVIGAFRGGDQATTDVHVIARNGTGSQELFSAAIAGPGVPTPFDLQVPLEAGGIIDFAVGAGGNGSLNDTTFFNTTISTPNPYVQVVLTGNGQGSVTSSPPGIDCGADCVEIYPPDTVVTLTANPGVDTTFFGFGGACVTSAPTCTLSLAGKKMVSAAFRSNTAASDTDGDGLPDGEEIALGLSPGNADTDGDGVGDGIEIAFGSDASNPASTPAFKRWTGAVSTDWSTGANWTPEGTPSADDDVLVAAPQTRQPRLTANSFARNLFVASGVDVDTAGLTLTVGGNVSAEGVTGSGSVVLTGNHVNVRGELPNVTILGHVVAGNALTVTGNLTIAGFAGFVAGGDLDVNGQSILVTGNLNLQYPYFGTLTMQNAAGLLTVEGDINFDGNTNEGLLTAGELRVARNFFVGGAAERHFVASGTFRVTFNGSTPQIVNFCCGVGPTSRRFQDLVIANPAGVSFATAGQVMGTLRVVAGAVLTGVGSSTLSVAGEITTEAGSTVSIPGLSVGGALAAAGVFSPGTTYFTGANQVVPGGLAYQNITVLGHAHAGGAIAATGGLTISGTAGFVAGGDFDVNGQSVSFAGNLSLPYPYFGTLTMKNPSGLLSIGGDAGFDGNTNDGLLTAGELRVGGNFSVGGAADRHFTATNTFRVVLNGVNPQTVYFCCGVGPTSRRFQDLVIANTAAAVSFSASAQVNGSLLVRTGALVTGSGGATLTVLGNVTTEPGSAVAVPGLSVGGVLSVAGTFSPVTTTFTGNNQIVPGGLAYQHVTIVGHARVGGPLAMTGNLTIAGAAAFVAGGDLDINGQMMEVAGGLNIQYPYFGTLTMQSPAGLLSIGGDANFDGNTNEGLTAGELRIGGNFFVGGAAERHFVATGTHRTVFNGSAQQTVNFCCGVGPASNRFQNLVIANPAGVSFASPAQAMGSLSVSTGAKLTGNGNITLTVAGNVTTESESSVTTLGLSVGGQLVSAGTFSPGITYFAGNNQAVPGGLAYRSVTILGHAYVADSLTVTGDLTIAGVQPFVAGGDLDLRGHSVVVTGNFSIQYPYFGTLTMQNPADVLTVSGDANFDGNTNEGLMSAGELRVARNVFVGGAADRHFVATGTHRFVFNGSAQQTVNFCCGVGPTSRRFQDLVLANPAGIVMQNDIYVAGRLMAFGTPDASPLLIGNGRSMTAAGVNVNGLTLDNARLTLNDGDITQFDNVVFRNYSPTATPLTVNRTTLSATFTGLQFTTAPTSGRYIVANDIDGSATPAQLTITASRPLNGLAKTTTTGGFVLNWGSPADDTDGDGATDQDELSTIGSDPLSPDTDGDGISDGQEVLSGWNPLVSELCVPPLPGLVSWWRAEDSGADAVGGNNGVLQNGVVFNDGYVGRTFSFDGANDFIQAPDQNLPLGAAPRTLQFWAKPAPNARVPVIYGNFAPNDAFYVVISGNTACIGNWGGSGEVCAPQTVTDNHWHHVALTYDGNVARLYIDGAFGTSTVKTYATTSIGKLYLGSTVEGSQEYYRGDLDEIQIYNRALTAAQVRAMALAGHTGNCLTPTYDASLEYSLTSNPNGTWTFGAANTLGAFVPFTQFYPGDVSAWRGAAGIAEASGTPTVAHNDTASPFAYIPAGQLVFHPGPTGSYAIVRWTAPAGGQYQVRAKFTGADTATTDVHVLQSGQSLFDGEITGQGVTKTFTATITVGAGETVDFAVGANGNYNFDTTSIDARIVAAGP